MNNTKKNNIIPHFFKHLIMVFLTVFQLFPLVMLLINTLRTDVEIKNSPIGIPESINLTNYLETWVKGGYIWAYRNSMFVGAVVILLVLVLAGLAGYGLSRMNIPGKGFFIGYFMLGMSFPSFLYIVPLYFTFSKIGFTDNLISLIIIYTASYTPFSILLIRTFFTGLPKELEEAGKIDGCSDIGVLRYITIPLAKPILTTVALIIFVWTWNEFLFANTFIAKDTLRTVSTRFYKFTSEHTQDIAKIYTSGIITLGPVIILYLFLQKTFIEGMTSGGLKG